MAPRSVAKHCLVRGRVERGQGLAVPLHPRRVRRVPPNTKRKVSNGAALQGLGRRWTARVLNGSEGGGLEVGGVVKHGVVVDRDGVVGLQQVSGDELLDHLAQVRRNVVLVADAQHLERVLSWEIGE